MTNIPYIPLAKPRSWTETLSATIDIIRHHYGSLFLFVIKHVAPWFLIAAGLTAYGVITGFGAFLSGNFEAIEQAVSYGAFDEMAMSAIIVALGYVLIMVVGAWQAAIVMTWLRAYHEAEGTPTNEQLAETKALHAGRVFAVILTLVGVVVLAAILVAVPVIIMATSMGTLEAVGLGLVSMLVLGPLFLYASIPMLLVAPITAFDESGFAASVKTAFATIRGYWWWMLGFYIVVSILVGICGYVFSIPDTVVSLFQTISGATGEESLGIMGVVRVATTMLSLSGAQLLSTITYMSVGVAYFTIMENRQGLSLTAMAASFTPTEPTSPTAE